MRRWLRRLFNRPEPVDPFVRMQKAVDELNDAWEEVGKSYRPWVLWEHRRVVIVKYGSTREVVYPYSIQGVIE